MHHLRMVLYGPSNWYDMTTRITTCGETAPSNWYDMTYGRSGRRGGIHGPAYGSGISWGDLAMSTTGLRRAWLSGLESGRRRVILGAELVGGQRRRLAISFRTVGMVPANKKVGLDVPLGGSRADEVGKMGALRCSALK